MSTLLERHELAFAGKLLDKNLVDCLDLLHPSNNGKILVLSETDCCWRLQTAFHASFTDSAIADKAVLQISRGTSIVSPQTALDIAQSLIYERFYFWCMCYTCFFR